MSQDQSPSSWVMALNTQLLPHALRPCVSNMAQARAKCMTITSPNFKNSLQTSTRRSTKRKPLHERAPTLHYSAERITVAKWTVKMLQKACAAPLGCLQCIGYSPLNTEQAVKPACRRIAGYAVGELGFWATALSTTLSQRHSSGTNFLAKQIVKGRTVDPKEGAPIYAKICAVERPPQRFRRH